MYIYIWSLGPVDHLKNILKNISSFGEIAQWLERVHGKHEVMGSNSIKLFDVLPNFFFTTSETEIGIISNKHGIYKLS